MNQAAALAPEPSLDEMTFVGRQPIFNRDRGLFAYELLYRSGAENAANVVDGNRATSEVMLASFMDVGLGRLIGSYTAFVNLPYDLLASEEALPITPDRVVLEVLETVKVDATLIDGVHRLHDQGFKLALDDFEYTPEWEPLIDLAEYIKFDVMALGMDGVRDQLEHFADHDIHLLAEKVETQQEFDALHAMGFHFFQGYFLSKPEVISGRKPSASKIATLQLLAALQKPTIQTTEIEELVRRDATLGYKLLNYLNSAMYALPNPVTSLQRAIVLLGVDTLKRITTLVALSRVDDKPTALMTLTLARARMCELLAEATRQPDPGAFFTVGLFSTLDAMLDAPLENILKQLPLADEIKRALLEREGPLGHALGCAVAFERCEWDDVAFAGLDEAALSRAYANAAEWAEQSTSTMTSAGSA